ncbi:S1/P1 nuclease [Thalassotalea psychrophila]|uniref:S1/P1 nuclease n=1 Tax=Thalassotalea psychrophila TaxID=3065647 RepID=A0ABY9TTY5_9GAMM|nr:S1/P1 nuclease [Colwelliaceae bacterium SQ149]
MRLIFILFILCFSANIYALGSKGHWLVCQLAFENLSSIQQNALTKLTNHFPVEQKHQLNAYLNRSSNTEVTFADACSWADAIRNDEQFLSFNSWHYLNVGREQSKVEVDDCRGNCIISAIEYHQQQFKEQTYPAYKLTALLFLAHWIGDIHQPLHVSFKSDLGGNKTKVIDKINSNKHQCRNLHQVWDRCLLNKSSKKDLLSNLDISLSNDEIDLLNQKNIMNWANQSLKITRSKSIGYCSENNSNAMCQPLSQAIMFDQSYYSRNQPILKTQIKLAAIRLNLFLSEHL